LTYAFGLMDKLPKDDPAFRTPPFWIHVSQAGRWLFSPREARKRAVIRLLDTLKTGAPTRKTPSA
jgi:hypothetical protein